MIVHGFESQGLVIVFALGLVAGEFVVGGAPILSEGGPVDFCAFHSDGGGDGRGGRVEGFEGPPFEVFGNGGTPVDDGAEDLNRVRLNIRGGRSGLASKSSAFGWGFWPSALMSPCLITIFTSTVVTAKYQINIHILGP